MESHIFINLSNGGWKYLDHFSHAIAINWPWSYSVWSGIKRDVGHENPETDPLELPLCKKLQVFSEDRQHVNVFSGRINTDKKTKANIEIAKMIENSKEWNQES